MKDMKEKSGQQDKDVQEGSVLKTAGPGGEITAGLFRKWSLGFNLNFCTLFHFMFEPFALSGFLYFLSTGMLIVDCYILDDFTSDDA